MKKKIKPCPGCGSTSICVCCYGEHEFNSVNDKNNHKFWRVHCQDCDWSFGGSSLTNTEVKAINGWNKRINYEKSSC